MSEHTDNAGALVSAARTFVEVAGSISPEQLRNSTPCAEYDVRGLLNHLLYWGPRLEAAARRLPAPPQDAGENAADLVGADWLQRLTRQSEGLAGALASPAAWAGTTVMSMELPASMVGGMVLTEFVVHGWDLAVATGQPNVCEPAVAQAALGVLAAMSEQGRQMGVFGAEVEVPPSADTLERALALSGRDPIRRAQDAKL